MSSNRDDPRLIDEVPGARAVRSAARHEAIARGATYGDLGVCTVKRYSRGREAVDVRRCTPGEAIRAELRAQIVYDDVKDASHVGLEGE